jgi:hypothetical protein
MEKTLQMVFLNSLGKNVSVNVTDIKDGITATEVKTLMELILARNVFTSTGGDLKTIMEANLVSRDVQAQAVK